GDGVGGQHVIAVHPHRGDPHSECALGQWHRGLPGGGFGDRPVVVLAEEHHRRVVDGGEHHRFVDVALRGGAVTVVGDHRAVPVGITGPHVTITLYRHRIPGGMQGVRADHQGVQV